MKLSPTLLTVLVALAVSGCGGGTVIDSEAAEEDIKVNLAVRDATVTSVKCPDDVDTGEGETYECVAETSLGDFRVIYRQVDDEGTVSQPRLERLGEGP